MELVYVFALVPALLWGLSPIFSKRGMAAGGSSLQASLTVVTVDSTIYWIALAVLAGPTAVANLTVESAALFLGAGVVGTALGRLAIFVGVDRVGASVNAAVISTRPLWAGILAIGFLGESVTIGTLAGILVLVVGLALLALSEGGDISGWRPRDLLYPLAGAAFFGVGNVARRWGLLEFPELSLLQAVALNEFGALVALATFAAVATRGDVLRAPRETYGYFAVSGAITAAALLSLFAALQIGRVVIVDPITATAPLFTAIFAAVFLRDLERVTRLLVVGVLLIVVGVTLVVTSPEIPI